MKNALDYFIKYEKQKRINNYDAVWKKSLLKLEELITAGKNINDVIEKFYELNSISWVRKV